MMLSVKSCRIQILCILTLCSISLVSQGFQNNAYNPSLAKERIKQAIDISNTDTTKANKMLDDIIPTIEANNDRINQLEAYKAKAKILAHCRNSNDALIAANKALEIASELNDANELYKDSKQNQSLLYIIIALSLGLMIFAYREYKLKKRANIDLSLQKSEIEVQKQIVDKRNKDITDSLNYAQRIQHAILETSLSLEKFFLESFIIFVPKDIVSGDFYWIKSKNDKILFAIADCTGHGVPGAFMSIIGTYGLNNLVNEFDLTNPGEILNEMNDLFRNSFDQSEGAEIFDGMDIGLCLYNPLTKELDYSGANLPLHILRENSKPQPTSHIVHNNNTFTLYQVKPNKQPIGYIFEDTNYVTHGIKLLEGDILYLFTDGFADQFGGLYKKKYRYQELRKLICDIATKPLNEQREILNESFMTWKGDNIQVDDMSFMGLRIS
jgi:serine phosphatase RsbU (regulator of sigma subunit)